MKILPELPKIEDSGGKWRQSLWLETSGRARTWPRTRKTPNYRFRHPRIHGAAAWINFANSDVCIGMKDYYCTEQRSLMHKKLVTSALLWNRTALLKMSIEKRQSYKSANGQKRSNRTILEMKAACKCGSWFAQQQMLPMEEWISDECRNAELRAKKKCPHGERLSFDVGCMPS